MKDDVDWHACYDDRSRRAEDRRGDADTCGSVVDRARYSLWWWYVSRAGRRLWKRCQKAGEGSEFWRSHECGRHGGAPEQYSRWWWWTESGRQKWRECQQNGESSSFWTQNQCSRGR